MAKLLKLRICRAVAAAMQSCHSKDPNSTTLPQSRAIPFPSFHVQEFKWKEEDKWHVVDNICRKTSTPRRELKTPPPPSDVDIKNKRHVKKKTKKKKVPSTSSADSGRDHEEEETQTLVSTAKQHRNNIIHKKRRSVSSKPPPEADGEIPARLSMLKKLIPCTVDGKVKESFAVVKKSEDPYEDFKKSMMEMILEKQLFEEKDLEQLLQCFLSLNSTNFHGIILEAFSEIWDTIFTH
ncbi:uncharacterized protein [Henckelia pumila]|uniref:uncharacterized protein n=1 Tax=Henckelia pumila TaxID=405737 RepID=UPI003C6DCC78